MMPIVVVKIMVSFTTKRISSQCLYDISYDSIGQPKVAVSDLFMASRVLTQDRIFE